MTQSPGHCSDAAKLINYSLGLGHAQLKYVFAVHLSTWKTYGQLAIMPYVNHVELTIRLKELRRRAGLSMPEMAKIMGLKGASSYQRYEDPNLFQKKYLAYEKVELLIAGLAGRGNPPITIEEIRTLGAPPSENSMVSFLALLSPEQLESLRKALEKEPKS